jgi:hypothetical protein
MYCALLASRRRRLFLSAVAFVATASAARAADSAPPPASAANPAPGEDAEKSFREAADAAAKGDLPTAIASLERVLQTNPDLANIKLELGLLYLRAGNADLARSYLQFAINAPDAPLEARTRALQAMRSATGELGRFSVTGSFFANLTYQSNPNGSPSAVSVTGPNGVPILLSGDDLSIPRGADLSGNVGGSIEARYGIGGQRGNDIVANITAGQTNYADTKELDASYISGQLGPRFFFGDAADPKGYIRPYGSGTLLALGHARYFGAAGGGVGFLYRSSVTTSVTGQINFEHRDYHNSTRRPTAGDQTGVYGSGIVEGAWSLSPRTRLSVAFLFETVDAIRNFWDRTTLGGQAGITRAFRPPVGHTSWLGRLTLTYRRSDYKAPDPLVDPVRKRGEDRIELEGGLSIPLTTRLAVELRASQTWNNANLPNYDYDDTLGSVGVSYRF